jgi:hypothetical protein
MQLMNMQSKIVNAPTTFSVRTPKDDAHIWRSKFFDQSARCETRLRQILVTIRPSDPVPHQFRAVAIAAKQSAEIGHMEDKIIDIVDDLLPLIELRACLAHSAMRLITINKDNIVAFTLIGGDQEFGQKVMLLNSNQRSQALSALTKLAGRMKRYLQSNASLAFNPPSSPHPPSQGATTGP